jgi:hypothetical protein
MKINVKYAKTTNKYSERKTIETLAVADESLEDVVQCRDGHSDLCHKVRIATKVVVVLVDMCIEV